jgi:hypothetical protein
MSRRIRAECTAAVCAMFMMAAQPSIAAADEPAPPKAKAPPSVTLTGCLRADGTKYKLTDLQGSEAPKGRTWKRGFIKKTPKDVEVVGASSNVKLKDHVGRKITIVGMKDGETHVKAQSVKRVAGSCP